MIGMYIYGICICILGMIGSIYIYVYILGMIGMHIYMYIRNDRNDICVYVY
jgi:hypothetical protein